jgi:segregation and condensation protein B
LIPNPYPYLDKVFWYCRHYYSMTEPAENFNSVNLEGALEALLFVAPGPVTIVQLAEALGRKSQEVEAGLQTLAQIYQQGRGLSLQWHGGRVQLTTAAEMAGLVERFLGLEATADHPAGCGCHPRGQQ